VRGARGRDKTWVVLSWFSTAIMVGLAVLFLVVSQSGYRVTADLCTYIVVRARAAHS